MPGGGRVKLMLTHLRDHKYEAMLTYLSQDSAITNCLLFTLSSLSLVRMRIGCRRFMVKGVVMRRAVRVVLRKVVWKVVRVMVRCEVLGCCEEGG